jgi:hypothetical protein
LAVASPMPEEQPVIRTVFILVNLYSVKRDTSVRLSLQLNQRLMP